MTDAQNTTAAPADDGALRQVIATAINMRTPCDCGPFAALLMADELIPLIHAREAALRQENERLTIEAAAAFKECSTWARRAGKAEGKLKGSEIPGVLDGWRERAETAESRIAVLEAALRPFSDEERRVALLDCPAEAADFVCLAREHVATADRVLRAALTAQAEGGRDA